jgi:2-methylisocitrate lyase-like PEP mutase family enzyme
VIMFEDDTPQTLREAIDRGNAYREAGADCIFVPDVGNLDPQTIPLLVKEIDAPVNLIAGATTPPIPQLQDLGVARVSVGPRPMRAVLSLLRKIAKELLTTGTYELMSESSLSYSQVNRWFTPQ